jgi:hypothetical protein
MSSRELGKWNNKHPNAAEERTNMLILNSSWRCLIVACLLVSACGGGGDSSPPAGGSSSSQSQSAPLPQVKSPVAECLAHSAQNHGIEGTGLRGVVTGVTDSTVTVSTIVFDASNADVFLNGVCATLGDVHPGATATVYGDFSDATHTGTATAIYVEEAVVGSIDAIDSTLGAMSVIGQSIVVTSATVLGDDIQPNQLSTLSVNDMIAVSGVKRPDGTLEATLIRRWPNGAFLAVAGVVTTIDSAQQLLRVGGVTVRYIHAQLVNFPDATIHPGDYVRALGQNIGGISGFESTSGIDASAIERAVLPPPDPRKDIVLNGAVDAVRADDDFDVMGQPVKITSGTRGTGSGPLGTDNLENWTNYGPPGFVTVFGSLDPSGYVIADLVVPQGGGDAGLTGPITAIDRAAHTLEIMGVPIQLSSYCYLADSDGQAIKFDALNVGDELSVAGSSLGTGLIDCLTAHHSGPSNAASVRGGGPLGSQRPILVLDFGIRADTTHANFYYGHTLGAGCSCSGSSADAFWSLGFWRSIFTTSHVVGTWTGDHIDATKVYWMEE